MGKRYDVGPDTKEFFKKYRNETSYKFKEHLFREMRFINIQNKKAADHKGLFANMSIITLIIGYSLILIAKIP